MYRTLLGIAAALAAALLIVGLSFSSSRDAPADFRFVNGSEPASLDPHLITDEVSGRIAPALFEGLTRWNARDLSAAPGVAESWEISDDQKEYRFRLRKNAVWTDGTPISAHDFVYSWKRLLDPSLGAEYAYLIHMVRFAEAYNTFDGFAEGLQTKIVPALAALQQQHPSGIDASTWQKFLLDNQVDEAFKHSNETRAKDLLYRQDQPLSAEELQYFKRTCEGLMGWFRQRAKGAREHFGVDGGIHAPDDHTLVVELNAPTPYFLGITSFYPTMPVPRHVIEAHPTDWFLPRHIVSNGPFRLHSWRVNDRLRMVKNPSYWGKHEVHLNVIDAVSSDNSATSLNLYLSGAVDWLPKTYPQDLAPKLRTRPDFYAHPGMSVYFFRLNTTRPPLNDARVRKAFNLAIDRKVITDKVLGLGQVPAYTFVPLGLTGYEPPQTAISFDVPRARALLAEAGFPDGRGFPRMGLAYNTNDMNKKLAEVVADQLRRNLGVELTPYNQEWQSFLVTLRGKDYDVARSGWNGDYLDPNTFLDMWVTNGANNQTGFGSSSYDALIRAAANIDAFLGDPEAVLQRMKHPERIRELIVSGVKAPDAKARAEVKKALRMRFLSEAEAILVQDEFPIIPLYFYVDSGLVAPKVKNFYSELVFPDGSKGPNLLDLHPLRDLEIVASPQEAR
jgi:oligopeptide transport system substrate-binding protein